MSPKIYDFITNSFFVKSLNAQHLGPVLLHLLNTHALQNRMLSMHLFSAEYKEWEWWCHEALVHVLQAIHHAVVASFSSSMGAIPKWE